MMTTNNNKPPMIRIRKTVRSKHCWPHRLFLVLLLLCLVGQPTGEAAALEHQERDSDESSAAASISKLRWSKALKAKTNMNNESRMTMNQILRKAGKKGLGGGIPGALAGVVQVLTLMWLRTVINYQARYGAGFFQALTRLHNDGGIPRFYRGLSFALVQAPLARFVSTAANDGVEVFLASLEATKDWGPGRTTVVAGLVVGLWRMLLMPVDTCKTVLQVDSVEGFRNLMRRVKAGKISVLYQGAVANALSAFVGHYPWFFTYNTLSRSEALEKLVPSQLLRNAGTGLVASIVADTAVNAIRVVKTTKQSMGSKHNVGYIETINMIRAADGWKGLFGRGLRARILANALQSMIFTVIWRGLSEYWQNSKRGDDDDQSDLAKDH